MYPTNPKPVGPAAAFAASAQPLSRRRLFELGGATVGLAALLAACGKQELVAPGRVGNAPVPTEPPRVEVNDAVYLRTMESLEHSILDVYAALAGLDGLDEGTTKALTRFTDDHTATAEELAGLTTDSGGESYACANPWIVERSFQPAIDNVFGRPAQRDDAAIPPSDDPERDALALMNGLETLATATYQNMVGKLSKPELRAAIIPFGAQAARRAAVVAIMAGGDENRYVSPTVFGEELTPNDEGFIPAYAIPSRFGQLTPVDVTIGAPNDLGLRYTATFETPAENAYRYEGEICPA